MTQDTDGAMLTFGFVLALIVGAIVWLVRSGWPL